MVGEQKKRQRCLQVQQRRPVFRLVEDRRQARFGDIHVLQDRRDSQRRMVRGQGNSKLRNVFPDRRYRIGIHVSRHVEQ